MSIVNITEIRRLAQSFRDGIESAVECGAISSRTTRSTMPYFPKGAVKLQVFFSHNIFIKKEFIQNASTGNITMMIGRINFRIHGLKPMTE